MKPAILTFFLPGRGIEEALDELLDHWDGEFITLGDCGSALARHAMPCHDLYEYYTPAMQTNAVTGAARRKEAVYPHLADAVRGAASPDWPPETVDAVRGALVSLMDTPHFSGYLELPQALLRAAAARRDIRMILVSDTFYPVSRLLVNAGRRLGIPSFELSHGIPSSNYSPRSRVSEADYVAVYNDYVRNRYVDFGAHSERIVVTGNPAWDCYTPVPSLLQRSRACEDLGLDPGRPVVNYGMAWSYDRRCLHLTEKVLGVFTVLAKRRPEWQFVLRPHPMGPSNNLSDEEVDSLFRCFAARMPNLVKDTLPVMQSLMMTDVLVVADGSGLGNEGVLAGRAVVIERLKTMRQSRFENNLDDLYGDANAVLAADTEEGLASAVEQALTCPDTHRRLANARPGAVRHFNHAFDGGAAQRVAAAMLAVLEKGSLDSADPADPLGTKGGTAKSEYGRRKHERRALSQKKNTQGELCFHEGRRAEALQCFVEACRQWPRNSIARNNIAVVLASLGKNREAWLHLVEALHHAPFSAQVRENLADLAPAIGYEEDAKALLEAANASYSG